ncbi:MAG TPA: phospholipid carrier-dependent glycosyltransferase, partial [Actinomycetota bacterium]|nr:phospholipid carrier-dependent glycosyltransferase [Actinomycetota bacterium]
MVGYQPILMLQRDTYTYLSLALQMDVTGWRPSLYPILIKPFVELGNLELLSLFQHLAGLAVAVMFYLLMRRLGLSAIVAALGVVPVLLDGYVINIEHYLLTEAFFNLFVAGALMLIAYPQRPSIVGVGASGVIIGLSMLLRFVGAVTLVPALLYVLLRRLGAARAVALIVGFAIPLGAYGLYFSTQTGGSFGVTDSNGLFLYGRVVEFADCDEVEVAEELQEYCPAGPIESETKGVFTSGLETKKVREDPEGNAKLLRFGRQMILAKPGSYAGAVVSDFARFFAPTDPEEQEPNVKRWRFVRTLEEADPHRIVLENEGAPRPGSGLATEFTIQEGPATFLRSYQNVVYTYGPLLALLLIVGL